MFVGPNGELVNETSLNTHLTLLGRHACLYSLFTNLATRGAKTFQNT